MIEQLSPSPSLDRSLDRSTLRSRYTRYFFVGMGWNFILMVLLGFIPDYVMLYTTSNLHAHWFSHLHGALMSLWLILFLVQATLVVRNNLKYHRQLGQASAVFGVIVWISMFVVSIRPRIAFPSPIGDEDWDVVLIQLFGIVFFGLFFAWGILQRKNSAVHKRLLLLTVIAVMQAAVDRMRFLPGLPLAFFVRFIYLDLLIVPLMIYDLLTIKRVHMITWLGGALMIAGQLLMTAAAGTPTWKKIAFGMYAPFVDPVVEVTLTDAQLAPLLGNYGDKNWNVTVSHSNGKTFLKLPDVPIFEMGAISETEFLLKTMTWKVTFVKAANGEVTKIIHTQPTVTWELPRMK